ncbi:hypothetical protein [Microbacterium sp. HJ5]
MGLISTFVDAFKKALGGKRKVDIEEIRSSGHLGPTIPTDAIDPIKRTAPTSGGSDVTHGDLSVASSDPEEGGEISEPLRP